MRFRLRMLGVVAAAVAVAGVLSAAPDRHADAAVPATIPLKITNNSGRGDAVFIYDLGTNLATGQQGWADANGTFHAWPAGGNPPTPAPDASIAGPANGGSVTIRMPKFSGRIYFSYGQKIVFKLTTGGLVQPAVQNPRDPNRNILFNWSEYTLNDGRPVDQQHPGRHVLGAVRRQRGTRQHRHGHLKSGGYTGFFNALQASRAAGPT